MPLLSCVSGFACLVTLKVPLVEEAFENWLRSTGLLWESLMVRPLFWITHAGTVLNLLCCRSWVVTWLGWLRRLTSRQSSRRVILWRHSHQGFIITLKTVSMPQPQGLSIGSFVLEARRLLTCSPFSNVLQANWPAAAALGQCIPRAVQLKGAGGLVRKQKASQEALGFDRHHLAWGIKEYKAVPATVAPPNADCLLSQAQAY